MSHGVAGAVHVPNRRDERGPERRFVLDRFPCIVVYVVTDTEIQIIAVVYGGREPGYGRKRR